MKSNIYIIAVLLLLLFSNCNKPKVAFNFDRVEHYSLPENDSLYETIYQKRFENLTALENEYMEMRNNENPSKINDTIIVSHLEKINFKKTIISPKKYEDLSEIFNPSPCTPFANNACAPIFRDIYIFKNHSKIVGIAKVCFECEILYFVDSKSNWEKFGDCVDFDDLKSIK